MSDDTTFVINFLRCFASAYDVDDVNVNLDFPSYSYFHFVSGWKVSEDSYTEISSLSWSELGEVLSYLIPLAHGDKLTQLQMITDRVNKLADN